MSMPVDKIIDQGSGDAEETLAESGFYWRETGGIKVLICRPLEVAGFVNAFSTRLGGVSNFPANSLNLAGFDDDSVENICENRRLFLAVVLGQDETVGTACVCGRHERHTTAKVGRPAHAGGSDFAIATAWQVHGNRVKVVATEADIASSEDRADALVSNLTRLFVGVKTADCVPVLVGDCLTGSFAAIHAGWRGTVQSIVRTSIELLVSEFGSSPDEMIAAIGPAATCSNYEIGQEVIDAFAEKLPESDRYFSPTRDGHAMIDLHAANRDQLIGSGVPETNIFTAPFCTMARNDLFFSYRLEKSTLGKTGRMLSVIGRAA